MAPTRKCFVDVGHCQVPLFIECGDVADAETADPRRSSYPNLNEKKKSRQIHDQKETLNCACGRDAPNVGQTIRSHPHRCRCPTRSGTDAKIYTQAAIIIKDQMGDEPKSKHFRRKKKKKIVPPIKFPPSVSPCPF